MTDEGGGWVDQSTTLAYKGEGEGSIARSRSTVTVKIIPEYYSWKTTASKSVTLWAHIIYNVEEWLSGGNPFKEFEHIIQIFNEN